MNVSDAPTGRPVVTLRGQTEPVIAAAFTPDGRRVATASRKGAVNLWDITSGQQTCSLDAGTKEINSLAFSADGWQLAALGRDGLVKLWDCAYRPE